MLTRLAPMSAILVAAALAAACSSGGSSGPTPLASTPASEAPGNSAQIIDGIDDAVLAESGISSPTVIDPVARRTGRLARDLAARVVCCGQIKQVKLLNLIGFKQNYWVGARGAPPQALAWAVNFDTSTAPKYPPSSVSGFWAVFSGYRLPCRLPRRPHAEASVHIDP